MTKRALRPLMEPLEGKALQSSGVLLASHVSTPRSPGTGLVATLTTDRRVYRPGQAVIMTLKETNRSNHSISVDLGPSVDGFYATKRGATVWRSNGGMQPMFVIQKVVPAHGSITLAATWDPGTTSSAVASPRGVFSIHSQMPGARPVTVRISR